MTISQYRDKIAAARMTEAHDTLIDPELLEEVAPVLRTLSHPMRLRIVDFLKDGEQPVSRIVEATGKTQALTSHQLGILRSHGVIKGRREGNQVFYRVVDESALALLDCIRKRER